MKQYADKKVTGLKVAYIGGGSRGWAWSLMADLAMEASLSGAVALYDIDQEAAEKNVIIGNKYTQREDVPGKWNYVKAGSLKEALTGADFVIISILPGTFDEMETDVHGPEKYNIWQSVGDTAGPGGLSRALRTVPMYVEIAEAIKAYSPNAWVINYTNPMSVCVGALYRVFPEIKAFGCCHEVFGTQRLLKEICEMELGLEGIDRSEIIVNVMGINHFTWFSEASYQGIDLFPVYRDFVDSHYESGYVRDVQNWMNSSFSCNNRVKFDLFQKYGWIAAAGDRHLAEFMPGDSYLNDPETVEKWGFRLTTVDWRRKELAKRLDRSRRLSKGEEEVSLKPSGEEGVLLMKALCGLERRVSNVNIPNTNRQIANLPETAIVETNALFCYDSIKPVMAGTVKEDIKTLLMPHVENHQAIITAALNCDFGLALQAFENDPQVKAKCALGQAEEMLRMMIRKNQTYLPEAWKQI